MGRKIKKLVIFIVILCVLCQTSIFAQDIKKMQEQVEQEVPVEPEKPVEPEEPEIPVEPEVPEEPEEPQGFAVSYEEPDGNNGYYRSAPTVKIAVRDEKYCTKYRVHKGEEEVATGEQKELGEIELEKQMFDQGIYTLEVWLEDEAGIRVGGYAQEVIFRIDTKAPLVTVTAPDGFDKWYSADVLVEANATDEDQVEEIKCYVAGEQVKKTYKGTTFVVNNASNNGHGIPIKVEAIDKAGNRAAVEKQILLDKKAPLIMLEGVEGNGISGSPIKAICKIKEENSLEEKYVKIIWEQENGEQTEIAQGEWTKIGEEQVVSQNLTEDGRYFMEVGASDGAGNKTNNRTQIIIDKTSPVIRYLEKLDGRVLKEFTWEYGAEDVVQDYTTFEYESRLDGRIYNKGERITREGAHMLSIKAKDAAGNEAEASAGFIIDQTVPNIIYEGVKNEASYEEEVCLNIHLEDKNDWIEEIKINGEKQVLNMASQRYQYTMQSPASYEVEIIARDVAGNQKKEILRFEIVEKKTFIQKMMEPLKKVWGKQEVRTGNTKKQIEQQEVKTKGKMVVGVMAGALVLLLVGMGLAIRYRKHHSNKA